MAGPELQPEAPTSADAAKPPTNVKTAGAKAIDKAEAMSEGAEKDEALRAKAYKMVYEKLGDATKHVLRDVEGDILPDFSKWPHNIIKRLRKAGRDYLKGLFDSPNFPGCKYLPNEPMTGSTAYTYKGEKLRLMAGNLRESKGDIDKVKFPVMYTRENGKKVVIRDK